MYNLTFETLDCKYTQPAEQGRESPTKDGRTESACNKKCVMYPFEKYLAKMKVTITRQTGRGQFALGPTLEPKRKWNKKQLAERKIRALSGNGQSPGAAQGHNDNTKAKGKGKDGKGKKQRSGKGTNANKGKGKGKANNSGPENGSKGGGKKGKGKGSKAK